MGGAWSWSGSDGVYKRYNLHLERELFLIVLHARIAGRGRVQFDVLDAHVWESVLEIGDEPTEVVKMGGAPQVKYSRAVRKLGVHTDIRGHLPAELRDFHFVVLLEGVDGKNHPRIHVARGHGGLNGFEFGKDRVEVLLN